LGVASLTILTIMSGSTAGDDALSGEAGSAFMA